MLKLPLREFGKEPSVISAVDDDDDSFSSANSHIKKGKGAIVEITPDYVPRVEFEIADYLADGMRKKQHAFHKKVRKSMILRLGVVARSDGPDSGGVSEAVDEQLNAYTKATDKMAMTMYMAVIAGIGSTSMPAAFKSCGYFPGVFFVCLFAGVHLFLAHRLIDVPQLVETNLEGYGDIAHALFNKFGWVSIRILAVAMWFNVCLLFFFVLMYYLPPILCWVGISLKQERWCSVMELILLMAFIPQTLRTDAKELRKSATWSVRSMLGIMFVLVVAGIVHGIGHWGKIEYNFWLPVPIETGPVNYRRTRLQLMRKGITSIGSAWAGLAILPYVVSDMMRPERAKSMMNGAVLRLTGFYVTVGTVGFFGWGSKVEDNVLKSVIFSDDPDRQRIYPYVGFFWYMAQLMSILMALKSFSSFPLFVWPLFRELDSYFEHDSSPPVALGLPWAINRLSRLKLLQRIVMLVAIFLLRRVCPHWRIMQPLAVIPAHLCQLVFLPVFIVAAISWHLRRRAERSRTVAAEVLRNSGRISGNYWETDVFFGDHRKHLAITVLLGSLSFGLGCLLFWTGLRDGVKEFLRRLNAKPVVSCECQN